MKVYFIGTSQVERIESKKEQPVYQIAVCSSVILDTGAPSNEESIRETYQKNYHRARLEEIHRILLRNMKSVGKEVQRKSEIHIGFYLKDDLLKDAWNTREVMDACDNDWITNDGEKYPNFDLWQKIIEALESAGNLRIVILGNSYFVSVAEQKAERFLKSVDNAVKSRGVG